MELTPRAKRIDAYFARNWRLFAFIAAVGVYGAVAHLYQSHCSQHIDALPGLDPQQRLTCDWYPFRVSISRRSLNEWQSAVTIRGQVKGKARKPIEFIIP